MVSDRARDMPEDGVVMGASEAEKMIYTRVIGTVVLAVLANLLFRAVFSVETLHADVHGIGAYVGVLGGLYSIVVAFLIYVVWDQYNRVVIGLSQEAAALEDLCRLSTFISDRNHTRKIRNSARQYMESTAGDEPRRLAVGETSSLAEEHFDLLCQAVRGAEVSTPKDQAIYEELLAAVTRCSDARDARLGISATRVPSTLWNLVLFASCALFVGFLGLGIHSIALSSMVVAGLAGTLVFLLSVIKDMDNPFDGTWNVSYVPMRSIAARIGQK
jgi:hypothetical protein